jgi:glycosyltransferase involved in cell wall biosynthesis
VNQELPVRAVLQVHTRYRQAGGEDRVVDAEKRLLEAAGVSVQQVIFDNADLRESRSAVGDLRLAASAIWSRGAERRVHAAIAAHRPDVVHVHNTFAAASPSVYAAAKGVPVVQTLHNYRLVCPSATAFRDGHACTDCVGRFFPWPSLLHACVHGSRAQSAVAAATLGVHRTLGTFRHGIAIYLAMSSFQRELMIDGGLPAEHIRVLPNFLEPDPGIGDGSRAGILYVGRLAEEKGVRVLLRAAALQPGTLRVAGRGPLQSLVERAAAAGDVDYLGGLEPASVLREMGRALAVVLPSIWFEGFPLTVVEAYATGTPVIASRIGSLAEIVEDGVTGLLAEAHDADGLGERLRWVTSHAEEMHEMGRGGRRLYERRFRGPTHLAALLEAYADVNIAGPGSTGYASLRRTTRS